MLILEFDFEATSPITRVYGHALARMALADEDIGSNGALWSRLVDLSIKTGATGGLIDREALLLNLTEAGFRLASGREYGPARAKLAELAQNTLSHIGTSVAGVTLPRLEAVAKFDEASETHRFLEVCGDPGVGKSGVLRHLAERVARRAPIIFLDRDATPPGGWLPFANTLGIPGSAAEFLTDLAASGGAMLFIDGLDMFDDVGRRRTIVELLRAASAIPDFKVIATTRRAANIDVQIWLDDQIVTAMGGAYPIEVGPLSEGEIATLVDQAPDLRSLLAPNHPAAALARNLYRLSRLLKVPSATGIRTEAEMAGIWWNSADGAPANDVRAAQRLMAALAESALRGEGGSECREDSAARSYLIGAMTLREVRRDHLDFYHDVLRDWAIGSYIAEHPQHLAALDMTVPVSSRIARGVEFAARRALEPGADCNAWIKLMGQLTGPDAHGSWRRQAILGLSRSEARFELLEKCSAVLLEDGASLLIELCTTVVAIETVATSDLMSVSDDTKVALPRFHRTDVSGSAFVVLHWVLDHVAEISISAIGAIVELVNTQIYILNHLQPFAHKIAPMLFGWLRQLDIRDAAVTIPSDRHLGRTSNDEKRSMIEQLRQTALLLGKFAPEELKFYLKEVDNERDYHKVNVIRQFSRVVAPVAPAELAELVLGSLIQTRDRRGRRDRIMERTFTFADSNYLPASPAQPPFLDLLESAPADGLRLIRTLVAEAITCSTDTNASLDRGFIVDFGDAPRLFPRSDSYLWSRDQCRDYSAASGLKALEAWSQQRLDDGIPVDEVLADILGPEGSCAAFLLVAVDVLLSHFDIARDALAPLLADPHLLATDSLRRDHDRLGSRLDEFSGGEEPDGKFNLADLMRRSSRRWTLFDVVHFYLRDDPVANRLRQQLHKTVASLEPIHTYSNWGDARFIARAANNRLQQSNWIDIGDERLEYRPPADEAAQLAALESQRVARFRSVEIESCIQLAIDGKVEYATAATARDAVIYAARDLPDGSDTDYLKSRSTRLIMTALLVTRDGDNDLLAAEEVWVRQVIAIALDEHSDRSGGLVSTLRCNRPAIAILTLIHLWARRRIEKDRNALIQLATRRDFSAVPAYSTGLSLILKIEPKLFKAAMRAAFANVTWRWKSDEEEDVPEHERFVAGQAAAINAAVAAEIAWLDGQAEPPWPIWPEERPLVRTGFRIKIPESISPRECDEEETNMSAVAAPSSIIHVNSNAAARWLSMVSAAPKGSISWRQEVVEAYIDWTARINGLSLPVDNKIDHIPHEWNTPYYAMFAERLLEATDSSFEIDLKLVIDLPDEPFCEVAQDVIHSADALYFNDPERPPERPANLRNRLAQRVLALHRWRYADDPASSRIDMQSAGIVAKIMLSTYNPFNGTQSYLPPMLFDRVDPLLPALRQLLPGGPTGFVAVCTMNLLLVATRARHIDFLLEATEAWFGRTGAPGLWIDMGIGRKVIQWLDAAIIQEPTLLAPTHPLRARIDRVLGRLVNVGVAEAHEIELRIEAAIEALKQ